MKLTGVDALTMFNWAVITADLNHDIEKAQQTRHAIKSKYEKDNWLQKVAPLNDAVREMKRASLVAYHLENSQRIEEPEIEVNGKLIPNPLYWEDANSLFKYFLIDVEMTSSQLTSRIKQAISSVQLFVQRCFLNLENRFVQVVQEEKEDTSSPNAWSQWKWMKNYRIWEANRKIFFYPENWLEPELRDDKSPFFKELENELLQNEVTKENVEAAFQKFLNKIDEISHLEVCGLYHQMEDLNLDEAGYETNIVHVVGRTQAIPNVYYYRSYNMNYNSWSAWEKIDVDITGNHIVPVVYNRKLYLFWLQFMEKPMKSKKVPPAQPTSSPTTSPEPLKVLEMQLGWTIKNKDGWAAKKISKQKLVHPWERPLYSYNLKPYYLARTNELYLDIYLSTSPEFNNGFFYDPYAPPANNPVRLTKNRFFQTYLPWHSSSFIFNGEIKDVKLKALRGSYYLPEANTPSNIDSYLFVHKNFDDGTLTKPLSPIEYGPRLKLPNGMHFKFNHLTNNQDHSVNSNQLRVLENNTSATLLSGALSPFSLVISQQDIQLNTYAYDHPMFYQDSQRAFFIKPEWEARLNNYGLVVGQNRKYRFQSFYHPYTMLFLREFNRSGFNGLFKRKIQTNPQSFAPVNNFNFNSYSSSSSVIVDKNTQTDVVDFSFEGANSIYNWELFFHAPLMVACRLMQNQKFEDAMYWFHYIFNPTDIENFPVPQRYWITKPFFEYNSEEYRKQRIESILSNLDLKNNADQLKAWKNYPFKPHLIARYRPVAYQKNVVMKYLDNLIGWGDMLFKRDTIESINEASLLYMLAYEILGSRPQKVPDVRHEELTFDELEAKLDEFGNANVDVIIEDTLLPITVIPTTQDAEPIPKLETLYFAIPANEILTKYWDIVEDRLFKIRHSMNIQGIVRQLPLFEPPIDPALLVKAAAEGIDIDSVLSDLNAPTPHYRFRVVLQKAIDFCNEVKTLGEKLLSVLEKKDSEVLALLRSNHEIQLLEAISEIRQKQIDETEESIAGLQRALELAETKRNYYESRDFLNPWEAVAMGLYLTSALAETTVAVGYIAAGGLALIPDFTIGGSGFGGSPHVVSGVIGGKKVSVSAEYAVQTIKAIATAAEKHAGLASTLGGYRRRKDEWEFQAQIAGMEKDQIQTQISAAEIKHAIAEKELENHNMQIENSKTVDEYLHNKFTNSQLYNWMLTQLSYIYFQSYQLAFEMAKKAEKCFQFELGITDSNIIQFGYWDSLKKGLLSGDKLMYDLKRLEAEYINQNRREFEITKHISLAQMAPLSLITLKETGKCGISLPEWLFDMDYPGHYMRRIKNVSITIPCIVGPFTGINCTLSLLKNETRMDSTLLGGLYEKQQDDTRFKTIFGTISSIATSNGQNDSGTFELNFNDDRYLPFEGAGVIADWEINMPVENNYFDFASISDVILHINYTSRSGGGQLAAAANEALQSILPSQTARLFSLKHEFATEWYKFLNPEGENDQEFIMTLKAEHFPFFIRSKIASLKIRSMDIFVETRSEDIPGFTAEMKVTSGSQLSDLPVDPDSEFNNVFHLSHEFTQGSFPAAAGELRLKLKSSTADNYKSLADDQVKNVFLLFQLGS